MPAGVGDQLRQSSTPPRGALTHFSLGSGFDQLQLDSARFSSSPLPLQFFSSPSKPPASACRPTVQAHTETDVRHRVRQPGICPTGARLLNLVSSTLTLRFGTPSLPSSVRVLAGWYAHPLGDDGGDGRDCMLTATRRRIPQRQRRLLSNMGSRSASPTSRRPRGKREPQPSHFEQHPHKLAK